MLRSATPTIVGATLAVLLTSTSAFALEGKALFEKIVAETKDKITYGSLEETGSDSLKLSDVKIVGDNDTTLTYGTLTLEGLKEDGDRVRLDLGTGANMTLTFPAQRPEGGSVQAQMKIAEGMSRDSLAPLEGFFAINPQGLSGRIDVAAYELSGIEADFNGDGTFETTMSKIALDDLSSPYDFRYTPEQVKAASGPAPEPLTLGSLSFSDTAVKYEGGEFTLGEVKLEGLNVPATIDADPLAWAQTYKTFSMANLAVMAGGNEVFRTDSGTATIEVEDKVVRQDSQLEGMTIDASRIPGRGGQVVKTLGYDVFKGRMDAKGSYDFEAGIAALDDMTIDFDDVAALSMSFKLTGYTPEIARQLNALSVGQNTGAAPADPMAVMQLLSQVKLEGARIAFKDDSITTRALEFQASQSGTTKEQLAAQLPMMAGFGLAQFGMADLTQQLVGALQTFMKDPGTLAVEVAPAEPVPFGDLFAAAQQAPKAVVDLLNVKVEATE